MTLTLTIILAIIATISLIWSIAESKAAPLMVAAGILVYLHAVSMGVLG